MLLWLWWKKDEAGQRNRDAEQREGDPGRELAAAIGEASTKIPDAAGLEPLNGKGPCVSVWAHRGEDLHCKLCMLSPNTLLTFYDFHL